jgi:hypothetical protein
MADDALLFTTRWVHVAEEDTGAGAVYRPDDENIPLSRKPRDWLELHEDGSAELYVPGPDDRPVARSVTWSDRSSGGAARQPDADVTILEKSPSRLLVKLRNPVGR